MAALGTAQTKNFQIGSAELRFSSLDNAGKMTQAHSVGLIQSASVNFSQTMAELKGGLPLQLIDSVVTESTVAVTAQVHEYTRANIRALINEAAPTSTVVDFSFTGTSSSAVTVNATTLTLTSCAKLVKGTQTFPPAPIAGGSVIGIFPEGEPEKLSIVKLGSAVTTMTTTLGSSSVTLELDTSTSVLFAKDAGTKWVVYAINAIGVGKSTDTQYYTLDLLSKNHTSGLVQGFRFWKASIQGGMDYSFSNDSFAVTPMNFKVLLPTSEEYATGGTLEGVKGFMSDNPLGMFWTAQA